MESTVPAAAAGGSEPTGAAGVQAEARGAEEASGEPARPKKKKVKSKVFCLANFGKKVPVGECGCCGQASPKKKKMKVRNLSMFSKGTPVGKGKERCHGLGKGKERAASNAGPKDLATFGKTAPVGKGKERCHGLGKGKERAASNAASNAASKAKKRELADLDINMEGWGAVTGKRTKANPPASDAAPAGSGGAVAASAPVSGAPLRSSIGTGAPAPAGASSVSAQSGASAAPPLSTAEKLAKVMRTPTAMVDVRWEAEGLTYRGEVKAVKMDKKGVTRYHVYYSFDNKVIVHDFDTDKCRMMDLIEPPIWQIEQMKKDAAGNYIGIMASPLHGKTYQLTKEDVEAHFSTDPEKAFLSSLTLQFKHVPDSGKKKSATSRVKQDCVPGGLSKAFAYAGDVETATTITAMEDAIIKAEGTNGDRMTAATHGVVRKLCPYEVRRLKAVKCALQIDPAYATIVTLKPGNHSVSLYKGLIFDSAEREPLPLTVENLTHCLGAEYEGIKRGYYFVQQQPTKKRAAGEGENSSPNPSLVCKKQKA